MSGNLLGPRYWYGYTTDTGEQYKLLTDESKAIAGGLQLNDVNPRLPKGLKPRVVFVETVVNGDRRRKEVIVNIDSPLYDDMAQDVTIDDLPYRTKGRRGERLSYGSNPGNIIPPAP